MLYTERGEIYLNISSLQVTTNITPIKARLAAVNSCSPSEYSWFKDFICAKLYPGEVGWISMSLRMVPEQMSLTFSSQLVTAVCQKSTASVCHCHWPRPSWAVLKDCPPEDPIDRIGAPQEIPPSLTQTQHALPSGHTTVGPIKCVFIWNVRALFTVQRHSWEIFSFRFK